MKRPPGDIVGRVSDLVISTANGKIAYAVLLSDATDSRPRRVRLAVPLGAFVVDPKNRQWYIEAPQSLLDNGPTMQADNGPSAISVAWENYVEKRYGEMCSMASNAHSPSKKKDNAKRIQLG